jgi:hypothetical protein
MLWQMRKDAPADATIAGQNIELVNKFIYLGSLITRDNNCSLEVKKELVLQQAIYLYFSIYNTKISLPNKPWLLDTCISSTLLHACET